MTKERWRQEKVLQDEHDAKVKLAEKARGDHSCPVMNKTSLSEFAGCRVIGTVSTVETQYPDSRRMLPDAVANNFDRAFHLKEAITLDPDEVISFTPDQCIDRILNENNLTSVY